MLCLPAKTATGEPITIVLDPGAIEALRGAVTPIGVRPMSPVEFSAYAGISRRTLSRCLAAGLPRIKVGRSVKIEAAAALEWLRQRGSSIRRKRSGRVQFAPPGTQIFV